MIFLILIFGMQLVRAQTHFIYGEDNRSDVYNVSPAWQVKAASTVALVKAGRLKPNFQGRSILSRSSYGESRKLCKDERFWEQSTAAFCSGSLIAPHLILTAGHCLRKQQECEATRFVFGWGYSSPQDDLSSVLNQNIYKCSQLITTQITEDGVDFALVQLDRAVVGIEPLPLRAEGVVSPGDRLVVIGHPAGLPTKIADGAKVRSVSAGYFRANLDTYSGNSGSPVFNQTTGVIEGVLVRGIKDFTFDKNRDCRVSNVCDDEGCAGESVTRIDQILPFIPTL